MMSSPHTLNVVKGDRPLRTPVDSLYTALGERILVARRAARLSQEQLAGRIGLTRTSVTNIERGRQKIQVHMLYAIAAELKVRPEALLPLSESEMPPAIEERLHETLPPDELKWVQRIVAEKAR